MKTWVMVWLWYLNALYWIGFAFPSRPEAQAAVASYAAIAPLIVWTFVRHRGLTRAAGLIHLPWAPLTIYLGLRLFTPLQGPPLSWEPDPLYFSWIQTVFWSTAVCLALDVRDLVRWARGERFVLGSPAAASAGASKLARQD